MASISKTDLILNPDGSVYHLSLLPEHLSDTIITVGDPERVSKVSQFFDKVEFEMHKREFITHIGKYKGKRITVISTGIGTDNVEIFFSEIDALANINLKTREHKARKRKLRVIRIGTSGAVQEEVELGVHLATDYAVGLDNLMTFYNLPMDRFETGIGRDIQKKASLAFTPYVVRGSQTLREQIAFDMVIGNTVTCPGFYAPQGRVLRLPIRFPKLMEDLRYYSKGNFRLSNFEMETSGYYAMARLLGHEALSVNAIIANRANNKLSENPNRIIEALILKVLERV